MTAAKEQAEQDKERQLEKLKEKLESVSVHPSINSLQCDIYSQDTSRTNERMRETLRKQEEEISRLRRERKDQEERGTETVSLMEKQDRSLLDDINEECRRIAVLVGGQPRVVSHPT